MVNYSIVIPHKNLPNLLRRCLDSIPKRDDLQIIVVDDNSDDTVVNFDSFPGKDDERILLIFDKTSLGAGHARNVGLEKAVGTWLVFADCDDFFDTKKLNNAMDEFANSDSELVYFDIDYLDSETLIAGKGIHKASRVFDLAKRHNDNNYIRFRRNAPWAKFVKKKLIQDNGILFQETRWSNDVWFGTNVALCAQKIEYKRDIIYHYTYRASSLIKASSVEAYQCRMNVGLESEGLVIKKGFGKYRTKHIEYWFYLLLKKSLWKGICNCSRVVKTIGLKGFVRGFLSNLKNDLLKKKT